MLGLLLLAHELQLRCQRLLPPDTLGNLDPGDCSVCFEYSSASQTKPLSSVSINTHTLHAQTLSRTHISRSRQGATENVCVQVFVRPSASVCATENVCVQVFVRTHTFSVVTPTVILRRVRVCP